MWLRQETDEWDGNGREDRAVAHWGGLVWSGRWTFALSKICIVHSLSPLDSLRAYTGANERSLLRLLCMRSSRGIENAAVRMPEHSKFSTNFDAARRGHNVALNQTGFLRKGLTSISRSE